MEIYSEEMKKYFEFLQREIDKAYEIAEKARSQGKDPTQEIEVPQATDMAGRVESLVGPKGVAERIRSLVKEYGKELAALKVVDEIIEGKFKKFENKEQLADQCVRTALAILTEGIVSAPLEGIADVKIKKNEDGTNYLAVYYAGPIRSSGGTAQALSVLVGDYVRKKLGLDRFKLTEEHVERYVEEIDLYHRAVTRLQYYPSPDEVRLAVRNIPIEITGETTDNVEVSHRNVPGVETNYLRGGAILVIAEGVLQKANKLVKYIDKMGIDGWEWLKEFVEAKEKGKSDEKEEKALEESKTETAVGETTKIKKGFYHELYEKLKATISPNAKYTKEIIGGRPLFAEPSTNGGFRLRYGRSRVSGFATWSINPAVMIMVDEFLAVGTQMKTERPGKGCIVTPASTIEGPIVKLKDGSVVRVDDYHKALELKDRVEEILYLGDALIAFGDFVENNQTLLPANYVEEWWIQELVETVNDVYELELRPFQENERDSVEEAADYLDIEPETLAKLLYDPLVTKPTIEEALHLSNILKIPLHPYYTLYWNTLTVEELIKLQNALVNATIEWGEYRGFRYAKRLEISLETLGGAKRYLELLGVEHIIEGDTVIVDYPWAAAVLTPLANLEKKIEFKEFHTPIDLINEISDIKLRDRGISWIGSRMGRPEKAKERKMKPPVHVLFPIGLAGGNSRDIYKAAQEGKTSDVEIAHFKCTSCGHVDIFPTCPECGEEAKLLYHCPKCGFESILDTRCPKCDIEMKPYKRRRISPSELLNSAMQNVGIYTLDKLKGVMGMSSAHKIAEPLEKGILRARNDVYVFKDGTIRFDATDAPITHFKPKEIGVSIEKLKELGYTHDFEGKPLVSGDQILELKVQDIILSKEAGRYLVKVAKFVDDLLDKVYGLPRFYNVEKMEDLIGHLVIGLAPHTSAGIIGRIIGFVDALVGYAHPYYHAAKRRNCFPGETRILVQIDGFPQRITLKELYELFEDEHYENMVYVRKKPKADIKVYSFDPETGKVVLTDIEDVIKAPITDHLIRFELELGRSFETTIDHPVLVYENGKFFKKRAFEVKESDIMVVIDESDSKPLKITIKKIEFVKPTGDFVFSLNAKNYHNVLINENIVTHQCDGDEDSVMLLLDALLNFSRYYLPEKRGGKMDAPLVVTTRLDPREVDSEVHNMDVVRYYPLEFYRATYELKSPKEVVGVIERVEDRLGKPEMYEGLKFTHDTDDIALGPKMSLYKQLGDMVDKVSHQLALAERIRAVNEHHVAETIINSHIVPDLRGNLRSFTRQEFRCVKCNTKYRRPPLRGKCTKCGGKIVLTVSKGAIEKYLPTAKMLVAKYNVIDYTRQRICVTEKDIKSLFQNVFPETQRTLLALNHRDICDRMIAERTGRTVKGNGYLDELKENGKWKKTEKKQSSVKERQIKRKKGEKEEIQKPKKKKQSKKVINLEDFFS
ncbi:MULTISPECIES: DNA-directed DNA polymerase II large subunit [Thermococcus]|uniref:DNA polymerase II large subunit n=2 Tax=Thermococcus sibiricus TaxID=172049 RepID=C6A4U4_THESM|nr:MULTISPECIES: DNA-directed DNA polymerase II large subunit [Thermococcus]ACS90639.1 DNA polymerase II large subunit [Thermococcus sibiricus MM 739]KUK17405.1 MAG: DNA polymerase II large subunit [Thermococcus sibiricus]MBC7094598.1 DNA-directed DNA polymerase II large subunit [Thermococcus sp.]